MNEFFKITKWKLLVFLALFLPSEIFIYGVTKNRGTFCYIGGTCVSEFPTLAFVIITVILFILSYFITLTAFWIPKIKGIGNAFKPTKIKFLFFLSLLAILIIYSYVYTVCFISCDYYKIWSFNWFLFLISSSISIIVSYLFVSLTSWMIFKLKDNKGVREKGKIKLKSVIFTILTIIILIFLGIVGFYMIANMLFPSLHF